MLNHFNSDYIHILNGDAMYQYLSMNAMNMENCAPFSEAMCVGSHTDDIFSDRFISLRCHSLDTSVKKYSDHFLLLLQQQLSKKNQTAVLWFDEDMFCQINLLVLLAYLEQTGYDGKVVFNQVDYDNKYISSIPVDVRGYKQLYNEVLICRRQAQFIELPLMQKGVELYLEYVKDENEITRFISAHKNLDDKILLEQLFLRFSRYGLGDTQYLQLIKKTVR